MLNGVLVSEKSWLLCCGCLLLLLFNRSVVESVLSCLLLVLCVFVCVILDNFSLFCVFVLWNVVCCCMFGMDHKGKCVYVEYVMFV